MSHKKSPSRNATVIGFVIGAICVIAAAAFFMPQGRPVSTVASSGAAVTAAAAAASPAESGPADTPANPHTFSPDRGGDAGPALLSGTLTLDPSITQSPGARVTVFVIARSGPGKGHPVLARRIEVDSFPATFSLSNRDSMMAGEKPARVSLEARIDLDGDALTREAGSPGARVESVAMGSAKVGLTLKPQV